MGKYKKFLYVFVVVLTFVFIPKVKADVVAYNSSESFFGFNFNNSSDLPQTFSIGANNSKSANFYLYNYEGISRPWTYVLLSVCAGGPVNSWYLSNSSYTSNYFEEASFTTYYSSNSCSVNGFSGNLSYIQFQVGKYNDLDGTGEELSAHSVLNMYNNFSYGVYYTVKTLYLSSDDVITQMANDSKVLNAFNDLENGLTEIDEGLSEINTSLGYLDSKLQYSNERLDKLNENQQQMIDTQKETNEKLDANTDAVNEQTETLKDSDSSDATDSAGSFFSGFKTDTFGLTSIITAPLNLITSITSSTCAPVGLPIPFVDSMTLNLPCLRGIYEQHFGTLLSVYQTITFGIVAYWVCIRIFALVKDFKNPEHDEIEVLDL